MPFWTTNPAETSTRCNAKERRSERWTETERLRPQLRPPSSRNAFLNVPSSSSVTSLCRSTPPSKFGPVKAWSSNVPITTTSQIRFLLSRVFMLVFINSKADPKPHCSLKFDIGNTELKYYNHVDIHSVVVECKLIE